jgi:hypothetical protein
MTAIAVIVVFFATLAGPAAELVHHDEPAAGRPADDAGPDPARRCRSPPPPTSDPGSAPRRGPLPTDLVIRQPILAPGPSPTERSTPQTIVDPQGEHTYDQPRRHHAPSPRISVIAERGNP